MPVAGSAIRYRQARCGKGKGRAGYWRGRIGVGDEQVVLHIEGTCSLFGTFEKFARLQKVPTLLARHRAVGDALGSVKDKAGQVTSQAQQRAGELKSQAGGTFTRALQDNPLPVGMVALGLGAAAGLLIPETVHEHRLMGQARDRFVEQAQGTAQDLTEKVKSVAGQAMDAAKDTAQHVARDQGLTRDQGVPIE